MTTTPTIGPFRFSVASVAEAERRLGLKLPQIIAEVQSDDGMGLRTLRDLMAAGLPPKGPTALMDSMASTWFEQSAIAAGKLIQRHGTTECAAAVGPAFGTFLASIG